MMRVQLTKGQTYQTPSGKDAYKLRSGSADVFLVPEEKGIFGRPLHIMALEAGMSIPGLVVTDSNYVTWRLQIEAAEDCELQIIEQAATRPLKSRLLRRAAIPEEEGLAFEQLLIERYMSEIISEDVFIYKSEQDRQKKREETLENLRRAAEAGLAKDAEPVETSPAGGAKAGPAAPAGPAAWLGLLRRILREAERGQRLWLTLGPCLLAIIGILLVISAGQLFGAGPVKAAPAAACCVLLPGYLVLRGWLERKGVLTADQIAQKIRERQCEALFRGESRSDSRRRAMDILLGYERNAELARESLGVSVCWIPALACWVFILCRSWQPALLAGLLALIISCVFALSQSSAGRRRRAARAGWDRAEGDLEQALGNMEKVWLAGAGESVLQRYFSRMSGRRAAEQAAWRDSSRGLTAMALLAGIAVLAAYLVLAGDLFPALIPQQTAEAAAGGLLVVAETLLGTKRFMGATASGAELPEMEEASRTSGVAAAELQGSEDRAEGPRIQEEPAPFILVLDEISFAYSEKAILDRISLCIREGEYLGIAGASGSGKSTLMRIITGLQRSDGGRLYWKGLPIGDEDRGQIRADAGIVLQNDLLMNGSIRENILAGTEGIRQGTFREAADAALLTADAEEMPMGWETLISERTETISAGQKQKILLARALVRKPRIIFLDEAESDLDSDTLEKIHGNLRRMVPTGIIVSHHLRSLASCDRIIVLEQGRIREEGAPEELLRKKGRFFELMRRQL